MIETPRNAVADVAIIGGGVAGGSLAGVLAAAGLAVVVVEREARFRDRIRGEALHPWGAAEVKALGLIPVLRAAGGQPLPIWQRYQDRCPVEPYPWADDVPAGHVEWGVSHPALQEALLQHAAAAGARVVRPAKAVAMRRERNGRLALDLSSATGSSAITARLIIGADGSHSGVRRWLGATTKRDPVHHLIGGLLVESVDLDRNRTHQAHLAGAMTVVFAQGDERSRVYFVCDPERAESFQGPTAATDFLAACAVAFPEQTFASARPAGPLGFFPGADVWADRLAGDGLVLVGDAAGANDPSQGHGLSLAFRDAHVLRDLLLGETDWQAAITTFAERRAATIAPLRAHAQWVGILWTEQGPAADARRQRAARAREFDPSAGGFAGVYAFGPGGLVADEHARQHFFGEDVDDAPLPEPLAAMG